MKDPIVEEVRRHRMEHTRKFGGDLNLIVEDLRRIQRESGLPVVRRQLNFVEKIRGKGTVKMTTDEIMALTRGEPEEE